jgi:hypothetical protein
MDVCRFEHDEPRLASRAGFAIIDVALADGSLWRPQVLFHGGHDDAVAHRKLPDATARKQVWKSAHEKGLYFNSAARKINAHVNNG